MILRLPEPGLWRGLRLAENPLIADHNHLMHLFLIRLPGMEPFLHLHPEQIESGSSASRFQHSLPGATRSLQTSFTSPDFRRLLWRRLIFLLFLENRCRVTTPRVAVHLCPKGTEFALFLRCFPQRGVYRIFIQIKRSGRVLTGVFNAEVD